MEVLFIVLNDLSYLDQIFAKFLELKVRGATVLDSTGMASAIMANEGLNFMLSGPFQHSFGDNDKKSKTIFTVIPDAEKAKNVIREIRAIVENSKKHVIGFMFTVPVSGIYPMKPKHIEE